VVVTDHADRVGGDWCGYADTLAEVEGRLGAVTVIPGVEVTVVDRPGGSTRGDLLVYGWPAHGEPPPANRASSPATVLARLAEVPGAFGAAAHPHNGGAPLSTGIPGLPFGAPAWSDWEARGLACFELLSYERTASKKMLDRWFALLDEACAGARPVFAIGGTDSHMPWQSPGWRGMTWVARTGSGRPQPGEVLTALRAGRSVVSGVGDFGTISIADAGPGENADVVGRVEITCIQRPARGRRCLSVELLGRGQASLATAEGPLEPTFPLVCTLKSPGDVVAKFVFARTRGFGAHRAEVWTNPVFIGPGPAPAPAARV
jgi:hypothetical protein